MTLKGSRRRWNVDALREDRFAWGCLVGRDYRFVYVFGPWQEYQDTLLKARGLGGTVMHKGCCATLAEAERLAGERAARLNDVSVDTVTITVRSVHPSILGELYPTLPRRGTRSV